MHYLVYVRDTMASKFEEMLETTSKEEADTWYSQWRKEYSKEDGYRVVRKVVSEKLNLTK